MSTVNEKMTALADAIRAKTGGTDTLTIDGMTDAVNKMELGSDPFDNGAPFTYTVSPISEADYGFEINDAGYYESQNKGVNSSYAICRVNLTVKTACDITFDVINYAEGSDFAIFGNLDSALTLSWSIDSDYKKMFRYEQSASVVNVTYSDVSAGTHFIDIKFRKDATTHENNDSVQFKIQYDFSLPQSTIEKILESDLDLVSENIKSGVDIFGVVGNYSGEGVKTCNVYVSMGIATAGRYAVYTTFDGSNNMTVSVLDNCGSAVTPLVCVCNTPLILYRNDSAGAELQLMSDLSVLRSDPSKGIYVFDGGTEANADYRIMFMVM